MNNQMEAKTSKYLFAPKMSRKTLKREVRNRTSLKGKHVVKKSSKKRSKRFRKSTRTSIIFEYEMKSRTTWEFADVFQNIDNWHDALKGEDSDEQSIQIQQQMMKKETVQIPVNESLVENITTGGDQQNKSTARVEDKPVRTERCTTTSNGTATTHWTAPVCRHSVYIQNDASHENSLEIMKNSVQATDSKCQRKKQYKCSDCLKNFSSDSNLIVHMRTHSGEKPFKCTECPQAFAQKCTLLTHQRIHSGEKPFKCTECPQVFSWKSNLTTHQRIHSGEKPFKCTVCPQAFSQQSTLLTHQHIHSGEKPFKCTECPQAFSQKGNLTIHQRIHLGEKPFKCMHCSKAFTRNGDMMRHISTHHTEYG